MTEWEDCAEKYLTRNHEVQTKRSKVTRYERHPTVFAINVLIFDR